MFDQKKFKALLVLKGMKVSELAKLIGLNEVTLYRKMNGKSDFYREEIDKIRKVLGIKDPSEIFFADELT